MGGVGQSLPAGKQVSLIKKIPARARGQSRSSLSTGVLHGVQNMFSLTF